MKPITLLSTLALGVSAFASGPDWVVGSYRLELSPEVKATTQKLGMPEPYARIMLRPDGTFTYAANSNGNVTGTSGNYDVSDGRIRLISNGVFPGQNVKTLNGNAERGQLILDGLKYIKAGSVDVTGTWTVRVGDREDRSIKMSFNADKSFSFACVGASSRGKYEVDGDKVTLVWTEVDGEAVDYGTMRKVIYLREDGSFFIDTYKYMKG